MGAIPPKAVTNRFPQTEENKTSEAPGVVFDPTTGEGGVKTPLPNDSSIVSISPPVGGRRHSFIRDWQVLSGQRVKRYHQWLHTAIPLKAKLGQISSDNIRIQGLSKNTKLWPFASSLFCQRTLSKGWKM